MKKKLIIVFSALALLLGCNKENVGIPNNVIVLWWGGTEEFGTLNSGSGIITSVGSVGDLQWWSSQCIVHGDTLHVLGENGSNTTQLKLYKCDLSKGNLLSQGNIAPGLTNLTIAGVYNNQVIVLGWNGSSEVFGTLNTTSGSVSPIGQVGDLQSWGSQCIVQGNTLYVFGENGSNSAQQKLYKCNLDNGNLLAQVEVASRLTNIVMAGLYKNEIIVVGWSGSNEVFGTLNTDLGTTSTIGQVGDLQQWTSQCMVQGNLLYALGNESNSAPLKLYQCDLNNGNLLSQKTIPSDYKNLTFPKDGAENNEALENGN